MDGVDRKTSQSAIILIPLPTSKNHGSHSVIKLLSSSGPVIWYFVFGAIHELCHVVGYLCLTSGPMVDFWCLSWWYDVLVSRQTFMDFPQTYSSAIKTQIDFIHQVGWISSLSLAIGVSWLEHRRKIASGNNQCRSIELVAWLTALEAIFTDCFRFSGMRYAVPMMDARLSAYVFYCGNFGIILLHHMWFRDHVGRQAALDCLERMVQVTMMRGAQSGGIVTYVSSATGMAGKRIRVVNKKRTDLSKELRKRLSLPSNVLMRSVPFYQGHTRFATSSLSSLAGTHPHQWTPPSTRCIYDFETKSFGDKHVENFVTHNGDFDFYVLNGRSYDIETVMAWLAVILRTPAPTMVDSLGIAGMIDILRCQGSFVLAARYALSMGIRTCTMDLDWRPFPTKKHFDRIGTVFEECWNALMVEKLQKEDDEGRTFRRTDSITFRSKLATAACQIFLKRMDLLKPLQDYANLSLDEEGATSVHAFCMVTVHAFFDHDLFFATRVFLEHAKGSFGLVVSSSLDAHRRLVIAARGQTVRTLFDKAKQKMM